MVNDGEVVVVKREGRGREEREEREGRPGWDGK
jgi:hypothetical protein